LAPVHADTLFEQIGGAPVLKAAVDDFAKVILDDKRINFVFAGTNMDKFKALIYTQLCQLSAGPCEYHGRDMRTAHAKLKIDNAQFNALTEDLYVALGHSGVSYRVQNKLIALLAPMQKDIVK
jgi:hemoglobin